MLAAIVLFSRQSVRGHYRAVTAVEVLHAACFDDAASIGILRRRLPVAAQIALATSTELYEHLSEILALK